MFERLRSQSNENKQKDVVKVESDKVKERLMGQHQHQDLSAFCLLVQQLFLRLSTPRPKEQKHLRHLRQKQQKQKREKN
jgi:hypothetical protein